MGYALIAVLALAGWWWLALKASVDSFMFAGFLSYLEAFVMEKWCIYCLWSQVTITAILVVTGCMLAAQRMRRRGI